MSNPADDNASSTLSLCSSEAPMSESFSDHIFTEPGHPESPQLEQIIAALVRRSQEAWPAVELPVIEFVRYLSRHRPAGIDLEWYLTKVHASDLYLACACGKLIVSALAAFDRTLLVKVSLYLGRLATSPAFVDEVKQTLREKLFVASPGMSPKIMDYSGAGTLDGWLRIAAIRTALNLRRGRDEQLADSHKDLLDAAVPVDKDAELGYLKQRYQSEFTEALRGAFLSLPQEQRHALRLHFAGGQTGDQIAALLKVNRSTVVRWLAGARVAMFHETRRLLRERLRLTPAELDSLTTLVQSQLDMNLSTLLRSRGESESAES